MPGSTRSPLAQRARRLSWLLASLAVGCASAPQARPEQPGGATPVAAAASSPMSGAAPAPAALPAPLPAAPAPATLAPACPRALALEAAAVVEEASCLLAAYVRIDTTNPPGNELPAARFLHDVLARDGIEAQIIESAPGRANLIARLPASRPTAGGAVVLMHHMDVVPASASEWSVPPLSGVVQDGQLWGRGSIDNKGGGVVHLMTLLLAKRLGTPLTRELVLLGVADEESGGGYGARFLTEHQLQLFQGVDFVLNEGGAVIEAGGGHAIYSVELAQKAPLWLRLTARGRSGHGAAPSADSAALTLVRALSRLAAHRFPIRVVPEVQALYAAKSETVPEPLRSGYRDLRKALGRRAFREPFLKEPRDAAMVQNTLAITMLRGSDKENVIAGEASAVLDLRLLPGESADAVRAEVVRVMAEPGIEVTPILSWDAHASPRDPRLFKAIEALAARRTPGAAVAANVIGGFTDCNAFRAKGIHCYGFLPMHVRPETFELIHGKDERIALQDHGAAVLDLHALLSSLDSTEGASP